MPDQESIVPASHLPVATIIHSRDPPRWMLESGADIISSLLPRLRNESQFHRPFRVEAHAEGERRCPNRRSPTRCRLRQRRLLVPLTRG